jgi:hypothetical protein
MDKQEVDNKSNLLYNSFIESTKEGSEKQDVVFGQQS